MSSRQTDRYFPSQESMFLLFLVYVWSFSFLGTWPVIRTFITTWLHFSNRL